MTAKERIKGWLFKLKEVEEKTTLREHEYKILSIIASCQTMGQLAHLNVWFCSLALPEDVIILKGFKSAMYCRHYSLLQEFNIKKANARGQTLEEYTEGKQKTWYQNGFRI